MPGNIVTTDSLKTFTDLPQWHSGSFMQILNGTGPFNNAEFLFFKCVLRVHIPVDTFKFGFLAFQTVQITIPHSPSSHEPVKTLQCRPTFSVWIHVWMQSCALCFGGLQRLRCKGKRWKVLALFRSQEKEDSSRQWSHYHSHTRRCNILITSPNQAHTRRRTKKAILSPQSPLEQSFVWKDKLDWISILQLQALRLSPMQ